MASRDINVIALVKGGERYVFLYDDDSRDQALEALAAETAGEFLVGDAVTLADLCLVPQLYACRRFGVNPDDFPTLRRVEARCAALPAFQAAHPDAQPDAVKP